MNKKDILLLICIALFATICFLLGIDLINSKKKIIKSPYIIYDNLSIQKMDNRGVYGIIDEKDLESALGIKQTQPFE